MDLNVHWFEDKWSPELFQAMVQLVILSHLFLIIVSSHRYPLTINTLIKGIRVGVSFDSVIDSIKLFPNPRKC